MPKPPIFYQPTDDTPLHYLHRARMFANAAIGMPDYVNSEQNWPKYALLTHAIELALKAYVKDRELHVKLAAKTPRQHDLVGWYELAIQHGHKRNAVVEENIGVLNDLHSTHFMRYPQPRSIPMPSATHIGENTVLHLIHEFGRIVGR